MRWELILLYLSNPSPSVNCRPFASHTASIRHISKAGRAMALLPPKLIWISRYNYWHLQCDPSMLVEFKNMDMEWAISVGMGRIKPKFDVEKELWNFQGISSKRALNKVTTFPLSFA